MVCVLGGKAKWLIKGGLYLDFQKKSYILIVK